MAKEFSRAFYESVTWKRCRDSYLRSKCYLCERCGNPAKIVHHKEYINISNCHNPEILLNWNNLEALCQDCHNKEHHKKKIEQRYVLDENGRPMILPPRSA